MIDDRKVQSETKVSELARIIASVINYNTMNRFMGPRMMTSTVYCNIQ